MRMRTVRNPNHPHTMLKTYLAKKKKLFTQLSKIKLGQAYSKLRVREPQPGRAQRIKALLLAEELRFKKDWETQFGWSFDDAYDPTKLQQHIDDYNKAEQEAAKS